MARGFSQCIHQWACIPATEATEVLLPFDGLLERSENELTRLQEAVDPFRLIRQLEGDNASRESVDVLRVDLNGFCGVMNAGY